MTFAALRAADEGPILTLISYAQNFEDVLLWRALGHVEEGFYVDVGAQHPRIDSVSQLFHEQGWHGIHIEPSPDHAELLRKQRPGDEVIEAALSAQCGQAIFHEIKGTGLSTLTQAAMDSASARGFEVFDRTVSTMMLDEVFTGVNRPIHWLKIDVEGHERSVIDGWTGPARPWVLLIESTLPGSRIESHQNWEPDILAKGYHFVWFDGLNRFYVHADHAELKVHFGTPPNVFDVFSLSGEATSAFANRLNARVSELEEKLAERLQSAARHEVQAIQLTVDYTETVAERDMLAQRVVESEVERARLIAVCVEGAAELDHLRGERDRLGRDLDALRQQLSERTIALAAVRVAGTAS